MLTPTPDGSSVLCRAQGGRYVRVFDARDGTELQRIDLPREASSGLVVDQGGGWFAIPTTDGMQFYPLDPLKWIEDHISLRELSPAERRMAGLGR